MENEIGVMAAPKAATDEEIGAMPMIRIEGMDEPQGMGAFQSKARARAFDLAAAKRADDESEEAFAGMPTDELRSRLEYVRLESRARMMMDNADSFGDEDFGSVFRELNKRRFVADDRSLAAFDALDGEGKVTNRSRLADFLAFSDRLSAAKTADEQQSLLGDKFASPALKAWREAKDNGASVAYARRKLEEEGRSWGDVGASLLENANPNRILDRLVGGTPDANDKTPMFEWLSDHRAVSEYEKKLLGDELRAEAAKVMPFLTKAQRDLVNVYAAGGEVAQGVFKLMKPEDREMMYSMCQAVRPAADLNWLSEMAARVGMGVRSAWRGARRADVGATDWIMNKGGEFLLGKSNLWSTPEEREAIRRDMLDDIHWAQSVHDLKLKDPEGFLDKALAGYADSASMQYSMLGGALARSWAKPLAGTRTGAALAVGGLALESYSALAMIGEQFDNMLMHGIEIDKAGPLAVCGGLVDTYVESMNLKDWFGKSLAPAEMKRVGVRAALRAALKMDGKEFMRVLRTNAKQAFKIAGSEVREELLQGMNQQGWCSLADGKDALDAFTSSEAFQAGAEAFWEALPACTAFGVFGAANVTGSVAKGANGAYAEHLQEVSRIVARKNGVGELDRKGEAAAWRLAQNEAARVAEATKGMTRRERNEWINAQEDLTLAEKQFYAEHCDMYEASVAQDGREWADAHLSGSIDEAMFAKAGWRFEHDKKGWVTGVTTANGERFDVDFRNREATLDDLSDADKAALVEAWNREAADGEKLSGVEDPRLADAARQVNGFYSNGKIVLFGARATGATLGHEATHGMIDALSKIAGRQARRTVKALAGHLGGKVEGGKLDVGADEAAANRVEDIVFAREVANVDVAPDRVDVRALGKNLVTALRKAVGLGKGRVFLPVVRTAEGVEANPEEYLHDLVAESLAALAQREANEAARKKEVSEARARHKAEREEKRQRKIELRRAEAERKVAEAKAEAERVQAEIAAAKKAKDEELRRAAEEAHERNLKEAEAEALRKKAEDEFRERLAVLEDRRRAAQAVAEYEAWKKDEAHKEEVRAEQEKQMDEILAEIAAEEQKEIDAINARHDAEARLLAEEEAKVERAREAEAERQRKMSEKMLENRRNAVKTMPKFRVPKDADEAAAKRITAAYGAAWRAKTGKTLTQEDVDALAEVYGLPPEALNIKRTKNGYRLVKEQLLSDESLVRFSEGLERFYDDILSVEIEVPDVVVGSVEEAANAVPNEVWDPVSETFIEGRVVVDAANAKSFREQAGLKDEDAPTVTPAEIVKSREGAAVEEDAAPKDGEETIVEKMTERAPVEELPIDEVHNDDTRIPNFKEGANPETGVVEPLMGEPYDLVANPIVVMEFKDGKKVVVTGRHRLDLYRRAGRRTIAARVIREADGWTVKDAQAIDAMANIIDEKGTVKDYVRFFENVKPTRADAEAGGWLARQKGRDAYGIYEGATPDTRAAIDWEATGNDGLISVAQAATISQVAPRGAEKRNAALQRVLVARALKGVTGRKLAILGRTLVEEAKRIPADAGSGGGATQLDLFASAEDLSLLKAMERQAEYRSRRANEYYRIAQVLRTAMQKGGKLELNAAYAKELGIKKRSSREDLAKARDLAVEKQLYWENAVQLEDADKAEMDRALAEEGKGAKTKFSVGDRRALRPADVFDTGAGDGVEIPVASLRTYKDESGESVLNAARFMSEAADGRGAKRKPLLVADNGDGTYTVVDGTATSKALAAAGAGTAYAKVVGPNLGTRLANSAYAVESVKPEGGVLRAGNAATLDEAIARAADNADALAALCKAAAVKVGGEVKLRKTNTETGKPTKRRASAERKLRDEYAGDVSRLVDLVGGTVVIDDDGDFGDALKAVERSLPDGASIVRVKKLNLGAGCKGYGDVKVNVRFANGGVGEVILVGRGMFEGKELRGGHEVYDLTRILEKYEGQSNEIDEALDALDKLTDAVYAAGATVPDEASFASIKARASSSITRLIPGPYANLALSSADATTVKSLSSGLNRTTPASLRSNATPALSLMKNMDASLVDAVRETISRPTADSIAYSGVGAQGGETRFSIGGDDLDLMNLIGAGNEAFGDAETYEREREKERVEERTRKRAEVEGRYAAWRDRLLRAWDGDPKRVKLVRENKTLKDFANAVWKSNDELFAKIEDWSSRSYKKNEKIVKIYNANSVDADDSGSVGATTIGVANERRRANRIKDFEYEIKRNMEDILDFVSQEDVVDLYPKADATRDEARLAFMRAMLVKASMDYNADPQNKGLRDKYHAMQAEYAALQKIVADNDIRFSMRVNPNLRREVDEVVVGRRADGTKVGRHGRVVFSSMPDILKWLGLPDLEIETDRARIAKIVAKHHLTTEQIADLPNRYDKPASVFRDGANAYVVLTDMIGKTDGGADKPVMVRLTRKDGRKGETVFVASAYPREIDKEVEYVRLANTPGAALFVDKDKVATLGLEEGTTSTLCTLADRDDVMTPGDFSSFVTARIVSQNGVGAQGGETRFSIVKDKDLLDRLNGEKTVRVYRAMQVIDGKLYPPMAAKVDGGLVEAAPLGAWLMADERPDLVRDGKFKLDKANGSAIAAAYNPYFHTSRSPLNDQFSSAYKRPNLVTVECEVPASELTSGYRAEGAKDAVGEMAWHSGPVSSRLAKVGAPRRVILSRYVKVVRVVPDAEVAQTVKKMLDGKGIAIPSNVVTPSLRAELEKAGVAVEDRAATRFSLDVGDSLADRSKYEQVVDALSVRNAAPTNVLAADATPKDAAQHFAKNLLGKVLTMPDGETFEIRAGHFFRLTCEGKHKGFVEGYRNGEEAFAAIVNGEVPAEKINGYRQDRAVMLPLFSDVVEHPSVVLKNGNVSQFIKRYETADGRAMTAVFRMFEDGRKILSFHGFGARYGELKHYRVAYVSDAARAGTSPATSGLGTGSRADGGIVSQNGVGAQGGGSVRVEVEGDGIVEKVKRLARPAAEPGADAPRFSIGDRSAANVAKFYLAREIMENKGRMPDMRRAANVARSLGYGGSLAELVKNAQTEAAQQTQLLRYLASDPKTEKVLADAGLALRNERAVERARAAVIQFSREVGEAAEGTKRATERAVRRMKGEDYERMVVREGLDLDAILRAIRPEERAASKDGEKGEGDGAAEATAALTDADRALIAQKAAEAIANGAEAVAKAKELVKAKEDADAAKAQDGGKDAGGAADSDEDGEGDGADDAHEGAIAKAIRETVAKAGFTLDSPEAMVQLVKAITEKYVRDFPGEFANLDAEDPWSSPLVRAKFAANLASFAQSVADAYAPSYARVRVASRAQMLNDQGLTTVRQIEEAGEALFRDLHADVIRQSRSALIRDIKKLVKPHAKHYAENELKKDRQVDAALGRYCKFAYRVMGYSAKKCEERAAQLEQELAGWAGVEDADRDRIREFADRKMELEMIDMFGNLRSRMPAELADLRDFVEQTINESRWEAMQFGEKWEAARHEAAQKAAGGIVGDPKRGGVKPEAGETSGLYSLIGMLETKARQLTRWATGQAREDSLKAFGAVEEMIQGAEDRQFNYMQGEKAKFVDLCATVYGDHVKAGRALTAEIDRSLWDSLDRGGQKTAWTVGRVMQMYVSCVQSDYADNCAKWGRDAAYVRHLEDVLNALDPRHMDFVEGLRGIYREQGAALDEVMRRTTGTTLLTPNRLYMPVKMFRDDNIAQKARARAYSPFAPSLTPRVKNGLDFRQDVDIVDMWQERMADAAHTIGWADAGSMVQGVLQSDSVLRAIRDAHGDKVLGQWQRYVLDILAGAEQGKVDSSNWGVAAMRFCARLASRTWLALNPASWAKQLGAVPCFALSGDGDLRSVAKSVSFVALRPFEAAKVMRDLAGTAAFQARYGVAISQEMKYATSGEGQFRNWISRIMDWSMKGIMGFDKLGVYALAGVYHQKRCELETQGKGAEEASELASSWLMHIVDKTAQTTRAVNTTELQRAGGAWGILLQFKSAPAQQTQFEITAIQDALAHPEDAKRWKKAAVCVLVNHVIVPTINTAIESVVACLTSWGAPDEEKRRRLVEMWIANIVSGSLGSVVFIGTVAEGVGSLLGKVASGGDVNMYDLRNSLGRQIPAAEMLNLWVNQGDKAIKALLEVGDGDIAEGVEDMAFALGAVVPGLSWISRKGKQALDSAREK